MAGPLKARFTYRMYDISGFFKAFKQRFSRSRNVRTGRNGESQVPSGTRGNLDFLVRLAVSTNRPDAKR